MTPYIILGGISIICFAVVGLMEIWDAGERAKRQATLNHLDRLRREKEAMQRTKLMRVVQVQPGEGLETAIRRAWIIALEHGPTVAIHLGIPVVVSAEGTPYEHEQKWRATAKLYQRREVCNGK
jgi:hypothetical protein